MAALRGDSPDEHVDDDHVVDREFLPVVVHSSPRYGRILLIGILLGVAAAVVLTFLASLWDAPGGPLSTGASGVLIVFALYALVFVAVGLLAAALVVIVLDSTSSKRARRARAEHATSLSADFGSPANDDVPKWVRDAEDLS